MALTNSQYNTIMRVYEERRNRSRDQLALHYNEVYKAVPEIKELNDLISTNSVEQARKILNGDKNALSELKVQLHTLIEKKKRLLVDAGFPPDYLEPAYMCPDCKDTGYIDNKKCHCFKKEIIDLFYTQSNLKEILKKENFRTFSFDYYSPNYIDESSEQSALTLAKNAYRACLEFARNFDDDSGFIMIFVY